ncbi:hypothetical protein ACFL5V_13570 [Fibrobacterota bacterium]
MSKNYFFLGSPMGLHGGLNYSVVDNKLEEYGYLSPDDKDDGKNDFPNASAGIDMMFLNRLALLLEYDLAMDDNLEHSPPARLSELRSSIPLRAVILH